MEHFDRIGMRLNTKVETHNIDELNQTYCPICNKGPMDGVTGARFSELPSDEPIFPENGTPTICAYCTNILVFRTKDNGVLTLDQPTDSEIKLWQGEEEMWATMLEIQARLKRN